MNAHANAAEQRDFAEAAGLTFHTKGMPPLDEPVLARAIEERLRTGRPDRALAHPTRLRCSDAYKCARQLAFASLGVPKDVQYSPESLLAFAAGDVYGQIAGEAAARAVDAALETPVDWTDGGCSLSGHADVVYRLAELKRLLPADHPLLDDLRQRGATGADVVCGEVKSMAGYGFRICAGTGPAKVKELPGPKREHLLQCGLYGLSPSIGARWLHMVYIDKDRNLTAEWIIGVDEPLMHLGGLSARQLVAEEVERMNQVLAVIDAGNLPARDVPGFGRVEDPPPADAPKGSEPWNCRYCSWQPTCAALGADVEVGWVAAYIASKEAA
jgi:hypothetical protein